MRSRLLAGSVHSPPPVRFRSPRLSPPLAPFRALAAALTLPLALAPGARTAWAQEPASQAAPPPAPPKTQPVPAPVVEPVPYSISATGPYTAAPYTPGGDVVYLKGGGMLRGTLLEEIPGDHVSVELAPGQLAQVPWDRVQRIARAGATPPAPVVIEPPANAATVTVRIESEEAAVLERREGRRWGIVCSAPCNQAMPLDGSYRISGPGIRNSPPFMLAGTAGSTVVLHVDAASRGAFTGGIVSLGTGPFLALVGGFVLLAAAMTDTNNSISYAARAEGSGGSGTGTDTSTEKTVGWTLVGGGLALAVIGGIVVGANAHSTVEQSAASAPRNDAWLRTPTWTSRSEGPSLPRTTGTTLFQAHF